MLATPAVLELCEEDEAAAEAACARAALGVTVEQDGSGCALVGDEASVRALTHDAGVRVALERGDAQPPWWCLSSRRRRPWRSSSMMSALALSAWG